MTKKVKLGLYGCCNRTRGLLESLEGEGAYEVVSAHDQREDTANSLCERFGGHACRSADEMLETKGLDAVMISLDPFAHAEAFFKTLEIGKPIFLEKPIAATARDAFRMMQAARRKKVPVHVGLIHRYYPPY
jgi:predicted dehydrogenase